MQKLHLNLRQPRLLLPIILIAQLISIPNSFAQCTDTVCVEVLSDPTNNQIVISAHKPGVTISPRPSSTRSRSPRPRATPRPSQTALRKPWIPWLPSTTSPTPRPKRSTKKVSTAALVDRFIQLVPHSAIHIQPSSPLITNVPVNYWSDLPDSFDFSAVVLGVMVKVKLKPEFNWTFADGLAPLSGRGAPFPIGTVQHKYLQAGEKTISLSVSWSGTAWIDGVPAPIPGGLITENISKLITIYPAHTQIQN